jgi:hypothetical protein
MSTRPENIGIKAIEIYFPNQVSLTPQTNKQTIDD